MNVTAVDSPESPLAVQNGKNGDNNILIANVREKSIKSKNLAQKVRQLFVIINLSIMYYENSFS